MPYKYFVATSLGIALLLGGSALPAQAQNVDENSAESVSATAMKQEEPNPKFAQDGPEEKIAIDLPAQTPKTTPQMGRVYQELLGDLDRNGHVERVALIPFSTDSDGNVFMQLTVFNDKGQKIWQSPRVTNRESKRAFGLYSWGCCDLKLLCDLDKDGYMELVEGLPRSDVRPMPYRVWKWDGDKFVHQFDASLERDKNDKELFLWNTKQWDGVYSVAWIDDMEVKDGRIVGQIISYKPNLVGQGSAYFKIGDKRSFRVSKWIKHILDIKF